MSRLTGLCDLHAHTAASDGDLTPTELVALAVELGLGALGVTDHDTVGGLAEALAAAEAAGLPLAPGVEISAEFSPGTMHILGYFVDHTNPRLLEALEDLRGGRDVRNRKIIRKLNELGMAVTYEEWRRAAGEDSVGRPQLARLLVHKGYVGDTQAAFDDYLAKGAPAYYDRLRLSAEESVKLILDAGGLPVLAHPYLCKLDDSSLDLLVQRLKAAGLAGIEAFYSTHTKDRTSYYLELAGRYGLLVTGGSDFHGAAKPEVKLGTGLGALTVSVEIFELLRLAAGK